MTKSEQPTTFGYRIDAAGTVWAYTAPARHGRLPQSLQIVAGNVWREGQTLRSWRNDQCSDMFRTQQAAARSLMRIVYDA